VISIAPWLLYPVDQAVGTC